MTTCGLWLAPRGLVAVLFDGVDRSHSLRVSLTDDARWGLAQRLAAVGADLVVDESILKVDPVAFVARHAGVTVWVAGPPLVASLRCAAGLTRRGARPTAAMLARLPAVPWLRSLLRRLEPPYARQITLL